MNKNIQYIIIAVVVLVALGGFFAFKGSDKTETGSVPSESVTPPVQQTAPAETAVDTTPREPSENPPDIDDFVSQPAYLIDAYTRHDVNYIGLDFVIVYTGEEAKQAQIEDGLCTAGSECVVPPGGYIRNNNPHYRTYELSSTTPFTIEPATSIQTALTSKGVQNPSPSFNDLKELIGTMSVIQKVEFPFKDPKSFVYVDIKDNGIVKIREPKN